MALKLTPGGKDLLLRTIAGEANINFSAIQFGNGSNAASAPAELSNPLLTAEITSYEVGDIFVTLTAVFSNSEISAGFRATELGVLADDPDSEGGTLLYAYEYTSEAKSDYIPASTDKVLETQQDVLVYIGDAENVTASISQSLAYASKKEFETFVARRDNPHKVTAKQVGLDKVPNVATDDQTPTWTMAGTLAALVSGEKLSVAFGKLAKAVSSLMAHLAATGKNIHKETPDSIGAAAASHKHSTTDITSGTLGVGRGGTAVTSYAALREKLGLGKSTDILAVEYGGSGVGSYAELREKIGAVTMISGSYVGSGTYKAENPVELTFDTPPKVLMLFTDTGKIEAAEDSRGYYRAAIGACYLLTEEYQKDALFHAHYGSDTDNGVIYAKRSSDGRTVSWYSRHSAHYQFNKEGQVYHYMALC